MEDLLEKLKTTKGTKGNWYLYESGGVVLMGRVNYSRSLGQVYMTQKEASFLAKKFNNKELLVEDYL